MLEPSRRSFISGLISFTAAAPAIVRFNSIMPVKALAADFEFSGFYTAIPTGNEAYALTREQMNTNLYEDLADVTRRAFRPRFFMNLDDKFPLIEWSALE
jgi:hypothetical protein